MIIIIDYGRVVFRDMEQKFGQRASKEQRVSAVYIYSKDASKRLCRHLLLVN